VEDMGVLKIDSNEGTCIGYFGQVHTVWLKI